MNCFEIFNTSLDKYIAEFKSRNDRLFVFQHIPKTAGSSVHAELGQLEGGFHWLGDQTENGSWDHFEKLNSQKPFRLLRGHMKSHHLDRLDRKDIPYQTASFLRDPFQQTVSHFRYCHSEVCPNFEEYRSKFPDITSFITQYLKPNFSTRYMIGDCHSGNEALEKIGQRFEFVGLTEYYNTSMFVLMACLGREFHVKPRVNITKSQRSVNELLTDDVRALIRRDFAIDLAVYDHFYKQFGSLSERVVEYFSQRKSKAA
ncbi:MAG: hypothetical protein AB8B55_04720 [Mariniblastus sp.]